MFSDFRAARKSLRVDSRVAPSRHALVLQRMLYARHVGSGRPLKHTWGWLPLRGLATVAARPPARKRQQPDEDRFTEVVGLEAELLGLITEGERVVASVRYSGLVCEARDAAPHPFTEVWYVQRALNDPDANW